MSYDPKQFRHILQEALSLSGWYSRDLEEILFAIAAHESTLGKYLMQVGGPARGAFGMEPSTMEWLWDKYIPRRPNFRAVIAIVSGVSGASEWHLTVNLAYQICMARINLARFSAPLPPYLDLPAIAKYWKRYWNTYAGKGTEEKFIKDYLRFV